MISKLIIAHLHVWDKKNKGDRAIIEAVQELLKKQIPQATIRDYPVQLLKGASPAMLNKINQADLVVIGGGGIFYHWFLPYDIVTIQAIKKPMVIFGVGYIREEGARALEVKEKQTIGFLCQQAELIGVRDYYTKEFSIKVGVANKKIKVIGDPAIFLSEKKTNKVNLKPKIKIGFNINYSGWLGFGKYKDRILDSYEYTANYFQKKYNAGIYYLNHHPSEAIIRKELKIKNLQLVDLPTRQQKFVYSKFDLIIGMMLHSCVMAFGAGTPEINLAYDLRNRSFAKFINHRELVISPSELRPVVLLKKALNVFKKRELYKRKFKQRKKKIWQNQFAFLKKIVQLASKIPNK